MEYTMNRLAYCGNPVVIRKAQIHDQGDTTPEEKIASMFYDVRDDIKFQFPDQGDLVEASLTIKHGNGQCNNKTILFLVLKALGIEERIHFSLIGKEIQRGLFKGLFYWILPQKISHCCLEVKCNDNWFKIDSYINDMEYFIAAKKQLEKEGWGTGYSVASSKSESSAEMDFDKE